MAKGDDQKLYWLSKDETDAFDESTLTLRRPYNDWSSPNERISGFGIEVRQDEIDGPTEAEGRIA